MFLDSCPICGCPADTEDEGFDFFRSRARGQRGLAPTYDSAEGVVISAHWPRAVPSC